MHKPETRVATVGARDKVEEGEQYRKISKVENGRGSEISKFWSLRERLETFFFEIFEPLPFSTEYLLSIWTFWRVAKDVATIFS